MIYITGDTHGNFSHVEAFTKENNTTTDDVLIILGDAGINYYKGPKDNKLKKKLSNLPITLFCVHGNHEERPYNIPGYEEKVFNGGTVYVQPEYPNILFAKDGEIFQFNGEKYLVIGGAYSVDMHYRLVMGFAWFPSEQPNLQEKVRIEEKINEAGWKVDGVLSHTCPYTTRPTHLFLSEINQNTVDSSMEKWLETISQKLDFTKWYFGHYHDEWENGKYKMLFNAIISLPRLKQ